MLDTLDRQIIQATQEGLPLDPRPYRVLSERLGVSEQEVCERLNRMLETGAVRRIAAVPNHYRVGYRANGMTVWDIADDQVDRLGEKIGSLDFVSHCYRRPRRLPEWNYNLFAMVHGKSREEVEEKAAKIREILGNHGRGGEILYSRRILKKTGFRMGS